MEIAGKTFLVTGGASGLGAATVRLLDESGGHAVVADLPETDVTEGESVQRLVDSLDALHGAVNCAGIGASARVVGKDDDGPFPLDLFRTVVEVNLTGTFNVIRLAATRIARNEPDENGERGVIVNTASNAAYEGQIGQAAYSASKGGVVSMTLPIARELARHGIRVMTIAPGPADTPMLAQLPENLRQALEAQIPFRQGSRAPTSRGTRQAHHREPVPERGGRAARRRVADASALMRPLDDVNVVSSAVNVPGPTTAARLVALGASVTKVEPPAGDPLAAAHPAWYDDLKAGQQVVMLDLKQTADRARLDELLEPADLLLTSSRPGALERLGLAWMSCTPASPASARSRSSATPPPTKSSRPRPHLHGRAQPRRAARTCRGHSSPTWAAPSRRPPRRWHYCSPASAAVRPGMRKSPSPMLPRRSRRPCATAPPRPAGPSAGETLRTGSTPPGTAGSPSLRSSRTSGRD